MRARELASLLRPQAVPRDRTRRRLVRCHTIADLRAEAERFLPRAVFDFVDGAAEDEATLRRNREGFDALELVPRILCDVSEVDLRTELLGCPSPLPLALGPTGTTRIVRDGGELDVARAASTFGLPYGVAMIANTSLEKVASVSTAPLWMQLYVWRDRGFCREILRRARDAGYRALLVTADAPASGKRLRDVRNGFTIPPAIGPWTIANGLRHPRWSSQFVRGKALEIANLDHESIDLHDIRAHVSQQLDSSLNWADIAWLRDLWEGPLVVKGVLSAADAREAVAVGAAGIVVSNHGGRQLDGVPATIDVLPEIAAAVGDRIEVLLDSGVRSGADVVRAVALGARGCLIGRSYLYGLAAGGQPGVERALEILSADIRRTMMLLGVRSLAELDPSLLRVSSRGAGRTAR